MKKPVLFRITNNLNVGGVQRRLRALLPLLTDHYEVHVVTYKDKGIFFEELKELGIKMHFMPFKGHWNPLKIKKLAELFKRYNADIVHTHSFGANISGIIAAALARVPIRIAQVHAGTTHWYGKTIMRQKKQIVEETIVHRLFTHKVVFVSQESRDKYQQQTRLPDDMLQILHNGISIPDNVTPISRTELGLPEDKKLIGFVGRLVRRKGVEKFLDIAREVSLSGLGKFHFVIVGGGTGLDRHRNWIREQKLDQFITLLGERRNIHSYYELFDCLIFCSGPGLEGMPGVVLEAAAHGLPLLVEKTAPTEEINQYYSRILFFDKTKDTQSQLEKALSLPFASTDQLINEFSIAAMRDRTLLLYNKLQKLN